MAQVFISYKREERGIARRLADRIEAAGLTVWWDPHLRGGERFDDVIEAAIQAADCVVVIWSAVSAKSRYVRDEATLALKLEKLVPVSIDSEVPPFRFQGLHTHILADWANQKPGQDCEALIGDLLERCAGGGKPSAKAQELDSDPSASTSAPTHSKATSKMLPAAVIFAAVLASVGVYNSVTGLERGVAVVSDQPSGANQAAPSPAAATSAVAESFAQKSDEPLRPSSPEKSCGVLNQFSREEWRRQFMGTALQDTWMVYVASGGGNAGAAEATELRATFERKHPNVAFTVVQTISRQDENERFAIAIALGLADSEVAGRLVWLAQNCGIAKDAYPFQQPFIDIGKRSPRDRSSTGAKS